MGPSASSPDIIEAMLREGVAGFRFNFSHGDENSWRGVAGIIREISEELDVYPALIGDLRGPQVRVGKLEAPVRVRRGDIVKIINAGEARDGSVPVPVGELFTAAQPGDLLLVGDGYVQLKVVNSSRDTIEAVSLYDGEVAGGKKVVIRGKSLNMPTISDYDINCVRFAVEQGFSHIAISYVESADDVELVRDIVAKMGGGPALISKVETAGAYRNLDAVIKASDVVLVARGDLGLHFDLAEIPIIQANIVKRAQRSRKPLIVATEVMESMADKPIPARSDVANIYTIVESMADAILLTNETAIGKYPLESVRWLKKVIEKAEEKAEEMRHALLKLREDIRDRDLKEKYARGLLSLSESVNGKVLVFTKGNTLPPLISSLRPEVPVFVGTASERVARALSIYYGINPFALHKRVAPQADYEEGLRALEAALKEKGHIRIGDVLVEGYAKPDLNLHEIHVKLLLPA